MNSTIQFFVPGRPATAGSKRAIPNRRTGKIVLVPDNKRQKPWMAIVAMAANEVFDGPVLRCPVSLQIQYFFPRPKSHFGTGRNAGIIKDSAPTFHTQKPDISKLTRAIEDALTGVVWHDDSQIVNHLESKEWTTNGRAGALVGITPVSG